MTALPPGTVLHHLAVAADWEEAVARGGPYERSTLGRSLAEEGFVHCSFAGQVAATAARHLGGREDVLVLHIDPSRLGAEVRVEDLAGSGEEFPHVYGPLPLDAVVRVLPLDEWEPSDHAPGRAR